MLSPRQAIEQWQEKKLDGPALMRALIGYEHWSVPISDNAAASALANNTVPAIMFNRDPQNVARLYIFSDSEAYLAFTKMFDEKENKAQHFIETSGEWVFRLPFDTIDELVIDPNTPEHIRYTKEQFPRLHELADAIEVEQALADLRAGTASDDALWLVKKYKKYTLVQLNTNGAITPALAPDDKERKLAALFTFDDTLDEFLDIAQAAFPNSQVLTWTSDGTELFTFLAKTNLDGVVFNCKGDLPPVAFALPFAQIVIDEPPPAKKAAA